MNMKMSSNKIMDRFLADVPEWKSHVPQLQAAIEMICDGHRRGALLMTCGNGGSAADASHIVGELVKNFRIMRPIDRALREKILAVDPAGGAVTAEKLQQGIRAASLSAESIVLTAMGNDVDFSMCFAQQVSALGRPGDIVLGLSTSGNSPDVVKALQVARAMGLKTIGLTGRRTCAMQSVCDVLFQAPADETYRIQEFHLALYHVICAVVETELFGAE